MRISVDSDGCIGAGQCAMVAGEVFDQDDDGIVVLLEAEPSDDQQPLVRRAASLCPARVISLAERPA
jgi:ferredoxin